MAPFSTSLKLYNTLTRKKEEFSPLKNSQVTLYTCGPTVYNYAHLGNFRTYVFEDLLRRTLQFFGMKVTQVMNLTDVDDKTIKGAIAQGVSLLEYTQKYKEAFFKDLNILSIQPAEHYPAATDFIPAMIAMIQTLLDKGYAYKGQDGSIYYAIQRFPHYGSLSHLHLDELKAGASQRVGADEYDKENVADFVLWKAYDPQRDGTIFWESPYGPGRPGWHLECSAMAIQLLGETLDIHVGGIDNMFPHHENEIAQSEACSGKKFARFWMHAEHLIVNGKKMAKSSGNFYLLKDLLERGYTGKQIRYLLLQTHYKTQLNFTFEGLDSTRETLQRLHNFIQRLLEIKISSKESIEPLISHCEKGFTEGLADDLNISVSLAVFFDFVREVNTLCDAQKLGQEGAEQVLNLLKKFNTVLAVLSFEPEKQTVPRELEEALAARIQARQEKNWKEADRLRDYITNAGYIIEDTPEGARLKACRGIASTSKVKGS
jgi:cysteinyl-tRNA synthetase